MIKEFSELDCVRGHTFGKRPVSIVCFCNSYFLKFVCCILILELELLLLFVMPAL